jgi:predicted nucleic acid-binding protein
LYEKFRPEVGDNTLQAIENSPDVIHINKYYYWNLITADSDDNKFIDCAIAANAHFICTEDKHFNILKKLPYPVIPIL